MDIFRKNSEFLVGLDIGSHSVKVVQLNGSPEQPQIKHFAVERYDSEGPEGIEDGVERALAQSGVSSRKAACSIAGPSVAVRYLQFPKMSMEELRGAVWWEGEQVIPFSMDDVFMDFQILREEEGRGMLDVLFVAGSRELVNGRGALVRECGLELRVLDVDGLASVNGLSVEEGEAVGVADIGARVTNLSIVDDRGIPFVRDILIAGDSLTEAISGAMEISFSEAETLKTEDAHSLSPQAVDKMEVQIRRLTEEIGTSLRYYGSRQEGDGVGGVAVGRLLLTGGSSRLPLLGPLMSDELGVDVEIWNPLAGMGSDEAAAHGSVLSVALGLARRKDP